VGNPIFISYRRDDTEGEAGRLFDDLTREFGSNSVFMDVAGIRPGVDFVQAIEQNVADCGVLLAIIGPTWATITGASGQRRLDDPNDFVVLEIASALKREVPVIPVLVHNAKMPSQDQLPESLKSFSHRNSVELSHARWPSDVQLLIGALNSYVAPTKATVQEPVHATVPVQLPAPHQPATTAQPVAKNSSVPLIAGIGALLVIVAAIATYRMMNHAPAAPPINGTVTNQNPPPPLVASTVVNQPPAAPAIVGTWKGTGPGHISDTLNSLVISGSGNSLTMHAFGTCQPPPCDWGTQPAMLDGQSATATFHRSDEAGSTDTDRVASVRVTPIGGNLDVVVHNTFTEQGSTRSNQAHRTFVPAP
jgi:TIR domain